MADVTWETEHHIEPVRKQHRLLHEWQTSGGGDGLAPARASDIIAWLRAAPEDVRAEVLGAFVTRVADADVARIFEDLHARAERAEAELVAAKDEVQTARKVVTAAHEILDGLVPRTELRGAVLETFGLETRVRRLRERAEKAEAALQAGEAEWTNNWRELRGVLGAHVNETLLESAQRVMGELSRSSRIAGAASVLVNSSARRQIVDEEQELIRAVKGVD